ncbi:MAG: amino acid adenylation domain-containing protein, partial [Gammaproteobacteria bacterium]|nr:amino acid adenylation domain-containing protein [Gammaproteobacteria bacterium]
DYLLQIQTQHQNDNRYAHSPLFEIQKTSSVPNGTALFDSLLAFENYPLGNALEPHADAFQIEKQEAIEYTNYPLTVIITLGESLAFKVSYDSHRISFDAIERMWGHLRTLLTALAGNPQQSIRQLPILTEKETRQLLAWNDTAADYPLDKTIVDLFERQVEKTPSNIAAVFEEQQLTYRQLNEKANQLAHHLLALKPQAGISSANPLTAIVAERSLEMLIGLLGILKAGGAYVPIDPGYPAARRQGMLEHSAAPLLLTQSHLKVKLSLEELTPAAVVLCLDEADFASRPTDNPAVSRQPTDLAYIIYTSGSTGMPKGVIVRHQPVINLIDWVNKTFHVSSSDRILFVTSYCFDLSVYDIFGLLAAGGSIHIASESDLKNPEQLAHALYNQPITFWDSAPAALQQLVTLLNPPHSTAPSLRLVFLSGDWIPVALPDIIKEAFPGTQVIGLGGATEATVWSNYYPIEEVPPHWTSIPYGKPIQNARYYILDDQLDLCPVGVSGFLYIGGDCLASGYVNDPEQTSPKFIPCPFSEKADARIYHTGDLARYLPDGNIEFLGRIDSQVKLRGFRIELGEIEAVLSQHEAVKEAVVIIYKADHKADHKTDHEADDNKRLAAYVTVNSEETGDSLFTELRDWLKARLPDYMIPSHFMVLEQLPLTANGKIDRKALPAPEINLTAAYEAPRNDIEQQLGIIWSRLLKLNNISIHDNFFASGGDSILSIQVVAQARQAGLQLTPRDLFEYQTIAELAAAVRFGVEVEAEQGLVTGEAPLTPIQQWFFEQKLPEYWHFNQSILLRVPADLNIDALRLAFEQVLSHHDALRLRYTETDGHWRQSFSAPANTAVPFVVEDLSSSVDPVADLYKRTQHCQT